MDVEVMISTENDKDFEMNLVSVRIEERLALAVFRPDAFISGCHSACNIDPLSRGIGVQN